MDNSSRPTPLLIPPGFEAQVEELRRSMLLEQDDPEASRRRAVLIEGMLHRQRPGQFPTFHAALQSILGNAYLRLPVGDQGANLQRAIACFEQALRVYTPEATPFKYATTQNNLGNAYAELPVGDRAANLQQAIACYEQALRVYTPRPPPSTTPRSRPIWAPPTPTCRWGTGRPPAQGHRLLRAGPPLPHPQAAPLDYAGTQNNLGLAYADLPVGDRAATLRKAIACYEQALRFRTPRPPPSNMPGPRTTWATPMPRCLATINCPLYCLGRIV